MNTDFLTSAQVSQEYPLLFPTQQSVLSAARRGVLSYYRISARRMLFSRAEIERDVQAAHVPASGGLSQKAASKITFLDHTKPTNEYQNDNRRNTTTAKEGRYEG